MSLPSRVKFWVYFPETSYPVEEFWECVSVFLNQINMLPKKFRLQQLTGHPEELKSERDLSLTPEEVGEVIGKRKLNGFHVDTGHTKHSVEFNYQTFHDLRAAAFTCRIELKAAAPDDWSPLLNQILSRWPSIGAYQFYRSYLAWQWGGIKDEFYEKRWGTFPKGYRTFQDPNYNEKTAVAEPRTFIDISKNPGRSKELLTGVHFFPTAEMWLGSHFWQYAKCTKEEALAADFFIEKRETPHYVYLKCWPDPFTRPDGEQGKMQQRLWKLFFHEDCEWPPGSGSICDDPIYGPPELMPKSEKKK